ncbi:M48 family metallopeptidase [bacterium]|nr:M48 family metallopeptidase [bacterium]
MFFFLVFVIIVGWGFSYAFNNQGILYIAVAIAMTQALVGYYAGDKITLAVSGAKEVNKEVNPEIWNIVENLTIATGLPMPKIYIINDSAPNAFATGRDPHHASIAFTSGILQKLDKSEIEGVAAHELSHIKNYDIRVMTLTVILVGFIALLSDFFIRWTFYGRRGSDSEGSSNIQVIGMIVGIVLAILSPIIANLIKLAISRKREFLADADGSLMTRYPQGLASALKKISQDTEPLEVANKATAHLYIADPLKEHKGSTRGWFVKLFSTHPPVEERIAKLNQMAQ